MICKRRWDGAQHLAKIIERRKQEHTEEYEYYVHYKNCESWSASPELHCLGMANGFSKLTCCWRQPSALRGSVPLSTSSS